MDRLSCIITSSLERVVGYIGKQCQSRVFGRPSASCGDMSADEVKRIWRDADAVCFDVDSTVIQEEGIDELAKFCGKGDEVTKLTQDAMTGSADFREMLQKRLDIISPRQSQLEELIQKHPHKLTPGIQELVQLLHSRNVHVYLVSGGFRQVIEPIARTLGISKENIYANRILFDNDKYAGVDLNEPTSRQMGKAEVISLLKKTKGYKRLVMIGDGATDAEACPPADAFIGFGGNVIRESVRSRAKWYVTSFDELIIELKMNCIK